jgi:hypothetical protein
VPLCDIGKGKSAEARSSLSGSVAASEKIPTQYRTSGKHLCDNSWQTISQAARDRNTAIEKQAQRKNQCCTTLAAIHTGDVTKIRTRILKKIQGGKKKWRVCISSG